MLLSLTQIATLAVLCGISFVVFRRRRSNLPLPPGPRGLPLFGNIFDVPKGQEWVTFDAISRKYNSDIIHLNMFGTPMIVLNSLEAAQDLFDKRSSNYADRPALTMLNELVGFTWHFAFMPYGETWKEHRKLFHKEFEPPAVLHHRPRELEASRLLLSRLLDKPDAFVAHLRHMAGMIILSTAYGIDVQPENDPYVAISEKCVHAMVCAGHFGAYLVDSLPLLRFLPDYFPGAGFKKEAKEWRKSVSAMPELPFRFVKESQAAGIARSSIASRILEKIEDSPNSAPQQEDVLKNVLAAMYQAGSDTTVSALRTFFLAMVQNPDIQKKAQAAVDEVVGRDRLPDFSDHTSIPFIDAVVKEVLRWRTVAPLAVPHAVSNDDVYRGYHIPAGSVIVGNAWAMLNDESVNREKPERWLTLDGKLNSAMKDPDMAFGFGRRICPGKDMAQSSIWITMSSILAAFNLEKAVDDEGVAMEPSGEYTSGLIRYPVPFRCSIRPRSADAETLIRAAAFVL